MVSHTWPLDATFAGTTTPGQSGSKDLQNWNLTFRCNLVSYTVYALFWAAQSAEAVEYTDSITAEGLDPPPSVLNDVQPSDGEAPVMLGLWGILSTSSLPFFQGQL